MPLTIVADIFAKDGHEAAVRAALEKLIAPTRNERGCLQYDLHIDRQAPNHFLFFENWESRELWQDHMKSPHITAHGPATEGMIDRVALYEMEHIA